MRAVLLVVLLWVTDVCVLFPPFRCGQISAAREAKAQDLIANLDHACIFYERDLGTFPPMNLAGFESGPCVFTLSTTKRNGQPYMEFAPEDVAFWPISRRSNLLNPVKNGATVKYRCPGTHNRNSFDIWCEDGQGKPTGINNWRLPE